MIPAAVAVPRPTWLPDGLDTVVELRDLLADPPRYTLEYLRGRQIAMRFALGVAPSGAGSAIGTQLRNVQAILRFPSDLFNDPGARAWRSLAWTESGHTYVIESQILRGEDVLHVGWSLDRTGAPSGAYVRTEIGSCASARSPTETVRAWVLALGRHDPARILDCFAMDKLAAGSGTAFAREAAELPTATVGRVGSPVPIAGRVWIDVAWTFDRDPGSGWAQGQQGFLFYLVGLEDGRYRIFEGGTGAYGPPP